ncbi:MAG: amino acid--tRNA ligase-related protein [bacterium]
MNAPAHALDLPDQTPVFHSALFLAPGRPRPLARRLAIHNRVLRRIRSFLEERRFQEIPVPVLAARAAAGAAAAAGGLSPASGLDHLDAMVRRGFPAVWCETAGLRPWALDATGSPAEFKLIEAVGLDLDATGLGDLMQDLVKAVAADLSADLLGGRAVTRLDQMLRVNHPRLTHTEAVRVLATRGIEVDTGRPLSSEAEASLVRYCGNLPVIIEDMPGSGKAEQALGYILPFAGQTMEGGLRPGQPARAGFELGVARLLQFVQGLGSVQDALIPIA